MEFLLIEVAQAFGGDETTAQWMFYTLIYGAVAVGGVVGALGAAAVAALWRGDRRGGAAGVAAAPCHRPHTEQPLGQKTDFRVPVRVVKPPETCDFNLVRFGIQAWALAAKGRAVGEDRSRLRKSTMDDIRDRLGHGFRHDDVEDQNQAPEDKQRQGVAEAPGGALAHAFGQAAAAGRQ